MNFYFKTQKIDIKPVILGLQMYNIFPDKKGFKIIYCRYQYADYLYLTGIFRNSVPAYHETYMFNQHCRA